MDTTPCVKEFNYPFIEPIPPKSVYEPVLKPNAYLIDNTDSNEWLVEYNSSNIEPRIRMDNPQQIMNSRKYESIMRPTTRASWLQACNNFDLLGYLERLEKFASDMQTDKMNIKSCSTFLDGSFTHKDEEKVTCYNSISEILFFPSWTIYSC